MSLGPVSLTTPIFKTNINCGVKRSFYCILFAGILVQHQDSDVNANFYMHCVQLLPQKSCKFMEYGKMFLMKSNEFQAFFAVEVRFKSFLTFQSLLLFYCLQLSSQIQF